LDASQNFVNFTLLLTLLYINSIGPLVRKPDGHLEIIVPLYSGTALQDFTWVERDLGPCALALFKNYEHQDIKGQVFHAVTAQINYTNLANIISKGLSCRRYTTWSREAYENISDVGLGKPVKFVSVPTSGIEEIDEMVCSRCRCSDMNLRAGLLSVPFIPRLGRIGTP
jgi:hypothetical protein